MGQTTEISWTDHTFNPWWGCTKVSPACDHCYAETFSKRVGFSEGGSKFPIWGKDAARRNFGDAHWNEPLKWNRDAEKAGTRKRVFCGSMCDVMEDYTGDGDLVRATIEESRQWLYRLIERTPCLDWLLLTKRPQNLRRFLPAAWLERPRANVWGMTTVESSEYLWRVEELIKTPFAVRGLSVEPLLGPLDLSDALTEGIPTQAQIDGPLGLHYIRHGAPRVDWVIVGGESGPGARPMHVDWARGIRDQCIAAGVAFHFKQWGEWQNGSYPEDDRKTRTMLNDGRVLSLDDTPDNETLNRWPEYRPHMIARVGKHVSGSLLDGHEWKQVPEDLSECDKSQAQITGT